MSFSFNLSIVTVQKIIDKYQIIKADLPPGKTVVIMDTYYFRRSFGVMVFRDAYTHKNLYWQYIKYETIDLYRQGIKYLKNTGWDIHGIVCDGRRGIFKAFNDYPVQMCQYHLKAIITRYLTQNPRLQAAIELKMICNKLTQCNKETFIRRLENWYLRWNIFLKEKTFNPETKKRHFTHRRLRSAYRSLMSHINYLFIYKEHPQLFIPNTTNSLEGTFSSLSKMLGNHAGLKPKRKIKLVNYFLPK